MLDLLKFALESPANFLGTITFICLFYALFGGSSLNAFKEFLSYRAKQEEMAWNKKIETLKIQNEK